ncbi:MAG: peptidase, partial [Nitrosopumilus sp. B06]
NYDIRSLAELGDSLADASIRLEFGAESVLLAGPGLERQAFVQLGPDTVSQIAGSDGTGRLVIDLGVTVPEGTAMLPLVADFVSIGVVGSRDVNNAIYRFELEETSRDSSTFEGTIEYSVVNQINIFDPGFIGSVSPISDRVRLIVTSGLTGKDGLFISYSDLDAVGVHTTISSQPEITTHTGTVSSNSKTFRFGQTVIITVNDPDLNLRDDISDVYTSVNDPNSEIVDTVGHDGVILLEVFLKDVRYKRCIVDGVTHDGLGSIGFSLVETGSSTGVFEGSFGMPSQICNRDGTGLMSPAGGSLDVKYHDARDSSGSSRVASLIARTPAPAPLDIAPHLSSHDITRPPPGGVADVVLSGSLGSHIPGVPLAVVVTDPDGTPKSFESTISKGRYKSVITINENSLPGTYEISLSHGGAEVGSVSFEVSVPGIPDWVKTDARKWSSELVSDDEFARGIRHLVESGLISPSDHEGQNIPDWVKNGARWWADDLISDEDFVESIQYLVKKGIIRV